MKTALNRIAILASADLTAAEVALRAIPNDDPGQSFVEVVMAQLRDGSAKLCELRIEGVHVGWTVYKIETTSEHREFVSIATKTDKTRGEAENIGVVIEAFAKSLRCQSIRMHTVRHGLVLKALNNGWHAAEIVLRKNLN
jgi:hypothetical protein